MKAQYSMRQARQTITRAPVNNPPAWVFTPLAQLTAVLMFFGLKLILLRNQVCTWRRSRWWAWRRRRSRWCCTRPERSSLGSRPEAFHQLVEQDVNLLSIQEDLLWLTERLGNGDGLKDGDDGDDDEGAAEVAGHISKGDVVHRKSVVGNTVIGDREWRQCWLWNSSLDVPG